jgi:pyruvate,water dikinase
MTPLFATWLVPAIEQGFQEGMRETLGGLMPYRFATVNGWYYSAPVPTAAALARVARESRGRAAWILSGGVGLALTDPAAADRLVLARLVRAWWHGVLPGYRALVAAAEDELPGAPAERLPSIVDGLGGAAGRYLWSVSMVGGSAWKMESALVRFARRRLAAVPGVRDDPQLLLRGLGAGPAAPPPHAVLTLDWHEPTVGELGPAMGTDAAGEERHRDLAAARRRAELACRAALVDRPMLLRRFLELLRVTQRYAVLREQQVRDLTLAWPVLRAAVRRLGEHLAARGLLTDAGDVFFLTHAELRGAIAGDVHPLLAATSERRALWERQRRLPAPLALGAPPRLIGDPMTRLAAAARGSRQLPDGAVVGHPASSGRAAGPVRLVRGPADFAEFLAGDVLVAATTAPAYTPLFARAAAVVTDGGTLAAHASLIAREYGIPAVVGTGDATRRLRTGQRVLVDGGAGTVTVV